jgi:pyruvate, water dikinase
MADSSKGGGEDREKAWLLPFRAVRAPEDVPLVGGKNASLGEMVAELGPDIAVPDGFCITAAAYRGILAHNKGLLEDLRSALDGLDVTDTRALSSAGHRARSLLMAAELPEALENQIMDHYRKLSDQYDPHKGEGKHQYWADVAVRSSATAEDLPDASFAGQQETFLNIHGRENLFFACRRCFASLFTNRAISYRVEKGFDHFSVYLSIGVQKMVRSDLASSGVLFTLDTESGFRDVCLVTGSWGLGENVVQGAVNPDEFMVHKTTLMQEGTDFKPLIGKKLGAKEMTMVYAESGTIPVKNQATPPEKRERFCVSDEEVCKLARWGALIERHYSQKKGGAPCPMDIEWAKDGESGDLFIVQARPETVHSQKDQNKIIHYALTGETPAPLVSGQSVGSSIGQGKAHVITDVRGIHDFKPGSVLVTGMTDPDWEPVLKQAAAVVTNRGGRTCHAAIISRELGIPCVVGCGDATDILETGADVTVDCSQGEVGHVLPGIVAFEKTEQSLDSVPKLEKTKITVNLANPERAFEVSFLPQDGIGLARMEFIINAYIKAHPLALLNPADERVSAQDRIEIKKLIKGYDSGAEYFVEKLAQGVGTICAAFYPKRVILRFSDFKTDEYANLLGGKGFEPVEANPMIGWRGASRYYDPAYKAGFHLECQAVKRVREQFGLVNLEVMIPFCRTVDEATKTLASMSEAKLTRGENGLKVIGMCEIPANVICAEEFLEHLDGFSIGSNDLTQLTLGVDRNSATVAHIFDERNLAVKRLVAQVIASCKKQGKYIGICGQAPSDFPEFAEFLVREGIESISLNPDTIISTTVALAEVEKSLG